MRIVGRYRRHHMAVVEDLVLGDAVIGDVLHIDLAAFAGGNHLGIQLGHVLAGDHGMHARIRQCLADVYRQDARMRMGAAQHLGMQHAGQENVVAKLGPSGQLVDAILARWPRAQHAILGFRYSAFRSIHHAASISLLAFCTARTILS